MSQRTIVLFSSIALVCLGIYGTRLFLAGQAGILHIILPFALAAFSFYVYFTKQ